jgi:DNA-binding LacI/PurR family transcriptional regulator
VVAVVETNRPAGSPTVRLSDSQVGTYDYAARLRGLRETIPGTVTVLTGGHNAQNSGLSVANHLVDTGMLPTAVVGLSDVLALGVLAGLTARGIAVPRDVSVCGFDDIPAARAADLTTVQQPVRRRGQLVGQLLIDPAAQPRQMMLPISLVPRRTTATARNR